jgi:isopropylmalate/homocitrate/citramalate synthase
MRDEMLRQLGTENPSQGNIKRASDYLIERAQKAPSAGDLEGVQKCVEALWTYNDKRFRNVHQPHGLLRTELDRVKSAIKEAKERLQQEVNITDNIAMREIVRPS